MKGAIVCFMAAVVLVSAEQYTDRFDNIDVNEIIDNARLLKAYLDCMLDLGKCTPEGRELKSHIKDALENNCKDCTTVQRGWTRTVIGHLINNKADYWEKLVAKYDPKRKFTVKYEKELRAFKA